MNSSVYREIYSTDKVRWISKISILQRNLSRFSNYLLYKRFVKIEINIKGGTRYFQSSTICLSVCLVTLIFFFTLLSLRLFVYRPLFCLYSTQEFNFVIKCSKCPREITFVWSRNPRIKYLIQVSPARLNDLLSLQIFGF